jgi:hypothetical protein
MLDTINVYDENVFAIDLIMDAYKITDPFIISQKIKEDLKLDVKISQIISHTNEEPLQKNIWSINSNEIFQ